jgi:hypothetical protein
MAWRCIEIQYCTVFSYRVPELAKLCSPLPGPSAIRLAIVGAAREMARCNGLSEAETAEEMLAYLRARPLVVEMPDTVVLFSVTIRRLAPQRTPGTIGIDIRQDALPREYALPSGPYRVWIDLDERAWGAVRHTLPWLRALGTRDSLCRAVAVESMGDVPWDVAAGEVTTSAADGTTTLELRDLNHDVRLDDLDRPRGRPYRTAVWKLPGRIDPIDETARVFVKHSHISKGGKGTL